VSARKQGGFKDEPYPNRQIHHERSNCLDLQLSFLLPVSTDGVWATASFGKNLVRAARRKTDQEAWMAIDGAFAARRCSVLDISEGGAKIKMDEPTFVRSVF
jgi:hypothetical protein